MRWSVRLVLLTICGITISAWATQPTQQSSQGQLSAVIWSALLDGQAATLVRNAKPFSHGPQFEIRELDAEKLRMALHDQPQRRLFVDDSLGWVTTGETPRSFSNDGHTRGLQYRSSGFGAYQANPHGDALHLRIQLPRVSLLFNGFTHDAEVSADADLTEGHALALILPASVDANGPLWVLVHEGIRLDADELSILKNWNNAIRWVRDGPAGAKNLAQQTLAWQRHAATDGNEVNPKWTQRLPGETVVKLVGVCHGEENPFIWWDGDGNPVRFDRILRGVETKDDWTLAVRVEEPGKTHLATLIAPSEAGQVRAFIGIGDGAFEKAGRFEKEENARLERDGKTYILAEIHEKSAILQFTEQQDEEFRLVAVDATGAVFPPTNESLHLYPWRPEGAPRRSIAYPFTLPRDKVDHYELQARKKEWVVFEKFPADRPNLLNEARSKAGAASALRSVNADGQNRP